MALENWIGTYIMAKDQNRPHLMPQAFVPNAELAMDVQTGAISFPSATHGEAEITQVLVRNFGATYENIYTFCISDARPTPSENRYGCAWLVVMSDKKTGEARLGCGDYVWETDTAMHGVERLTIVIKTMAVLPATALKPLLAWATQLSYPWSNRSELRALMPHDDAYAAIRTHLLGD